MVANEHQPPVKTWRMFDVTGEFIYHLPFKIIMHHLDGLLWS